MANFENVEDAREFFYKDLFAVNMGITLDELTDEEAVCSVVLTDEHKNAYGGVMGGAIFTLCDFAFAVLSNQIHQLTVAQQVSINYLSAPKGDKLIARARCRKSGRTSSIVIVDVEDDLGRDIAQFVGTGFKL
ncbi:MAG: PaaI family thioesterase [Methanobrevibacter sp.]|nr:PaaI family thioesterase [Methanobrevibacter sp.]